MGFNQEISEAAEVIKDAEKVTIISHIDADGITSEAIMRQAVSRCGIQINSVFVRQLEPLTMKHVPEDDSLKIFIDLGAGQQNLLEERGLSELSSFTEESTEVPITWAKFAIKLFDSEGSETSPSLL